MVAALPFIVYLFIDDRFGPPVMVTREYARLVALNGMSVAALIALIGLLSSTLLATRQV